MPADSIYETLQTVESGMPLRRLVGMLASALSMLSLRQTRLLSKTPKLKDRGSLRQMKEMSLEKNMFNIMFNRCNKCSPGIVSGGLAQMVERSLCMREVGGSIPSASKFILLPHSHIFLPLAPFLLQERVCIHTDLL